MLTEQTKRLTLIGGFILSVIAIAFALYYFFFRTGANEITHAPSSTAENFPGGTLPSSKTGAARTNEETSTAPSNLTQAAPVANGGVTQTTELTTGPVEDVTLAGDGNHMNFYDKTDGKFYTIGVDGKVTALSRQSFPGVDKATWDHTSQKAILEYPDNSKIIYDFSAKKQVTLPKHWEGFSFSPVTDEFAAKSVTLDPDNRFIVTAHADGTNIQSVQALGDHQDNVQVDWSPNNQVVAFANTQTESTGSIDRRVIYPIGKNQENLKGLTVEGIGFQPSWSPDGKKLLYSAAGSYSDYKPLLWLVDGSAATIGQNRHSVTLNTWAEKCTWGDPSTVYCAVPQNLPENAGLQESLYSDLPDSLYKVDVTTGTSTLVAIPDENKTLTHLFVSKDASTLYYTDGATNHLQFLKLK